MRGISLIIAAALLSAGGASAPSLADGETFKDCQQCPEMIALRGGSFTMGSPESEPERRSNEGPQRRVTIAGFAVGKYEVTFAEWDACVSAGGCSHRPEDRWGRGDQPMMRVSWNDAQEYVRWLSQQTGQIYRLPSEAEWEYAARAGTETPFHTGPRITLEQANFKGNQGYNGSAKGVWPKQTVPVGSFPANGWGLHDVHGNVWEWVQDCWHGDYSGAPTDGSAWMNDSNGDCSMAVLRGGSWSFDPWYLRSAVRLGVPRDVRNYIFGFRVARTLKCLADVATECVRPSSAAEPPAPPPPAFPREADYRAAQTELRRLRLYSSGIDGDWGPGSRRAMTAFQRQAGIAPADGALTELSLAALRLAPTPPEPERQSEPVAPPPAPQPASGLSRTPGERFQDCDACPEMVVIPAGSFTMGSPENEPDRYRNEGPQRRVNVPSFALGRTEVTFQQWDACVSAGGCSHRPDDEGWGRGSRPVITVSWKDAQEYVTWLNSQTDGAPYRLPSEAEWEYAARAGTQSAYLWGTDKNAGCRFANGADQSANLLFVSTCDDGHARTAPVGSYQANAFGLSDMNGNVWEWVQDCWHGDYNGAPTDGSAWMNDRNGVCYRAMQRGGSWGGRSWYLRSAFRGWHPRGNRSSGFGFRVARTLNR